MSDEPSGATAVQELTVGTAVQVLGAAVGLGAYVALAGGAAEWARVAATGLSASQALPAMEPVALLASGYRILLVVPLVYAVVRVCLRVSKDLGDSPREPPVATAARQGWRIGTHLVLVYLALTVASVPALLLSGLVVVVAGGVGWFATTALAVAIVGVVLAIALSLRRGLPGLTETWSNLPPIRALGRREASVPGLLRQIVRRSIDSNVGYSAAATLVLVACLTTLAVVAAERGPAWLYLVGLALLWIALAAGVLVLGGALTLRVAVARDLARMPDAERRARFSVFGVVVLVAALFVLPQSWGVLTIVMMLIALLAEELPPTLTARSLAVSAALALGLMGFQGHLPQRFDRLELTVPRHGGVGPLQMRVAVIGTRGDSYLVGACDRTPHDYLGTHGWSSSHPSLLRLPKADAADAVIIRGGYAFLPRHEPSLGGAMLSAIDESLDLPAAVSSMTLHPPSSAHAIGADVCGGPAGSVDHARAAIRALEQTH